MAKKSPPPPADGTKAVRISDAHHVRLQKMAESNRRTLSGQLAWLIDWAWSTEQAGGADSLPGEQK